MNYNTAISRAPSRKIFAPMFRARWQNMQNIVNDSVYIDKVAGPYKTYYIAFIQQWLQWARGFVPQLHQKDFFSTGIGYTSCDLLTKLCMAGGYRLHASSEDTQKFIEKWQKDELMNTFNEMFFEANAGGNSLLVITPINNELYPFVIPINRATFQIGRTGKVTNTRILNRFVAGETAYYAEEIRAIKNGVAYWRVRLACASPILSPSWGQNWLKKVPDAIAEQWEYNYGNIQPGKWYKMPTRLRGIGVYNVRNKARASAFSDMPGYSDSSLHTCLDILYSIDYNYTQGQVDQYMGRSRCLIPKNMSGRVVQGTIGTLTEGMSFREAINYELPPLEEDFYTQIGDQTVDGKPIQPTFIQPDLRGEARRFIRDADIELLAGKLGIAASTLAAHLAGGGTKTDDQINAEGGIEEKTVGNKRDLADRAINAMLSDVAYFYGYDDAGISIQWGRSTSNSARENEELFRDYQGGTISLKDYLKKRWPDMSEAEIDKKVAELEAKQKEASAFDFPHISESEGAGYEYSDRSSEPDGAGT